MNLVFVILLVAAALAMIFLFYMGVFSKVSLSEQVKGPYTFSYVEHIGPYHEVGKPMMELDAKMRALGFNSTDGLGIYYDDPKKIQKDKLRSEVGSIITAVDMDKIDAHRGALNIKTIEKKKYLVAEFPIKNVLSYMIGPMKVYPVFARYLESNGGFAPDKGIELYDMANKKIVFLMGLE